MEWCDLLIEVRFGLLPASSVDPVDCVTSMGRGNQHSASQDTVSNAYYPTYKPSFSKKLRTGITKLISTRAGLIKELRLPAMHMYVVR